MIRSTFFIFCCLLEGTSLSQENVDEIQSVFGSMELRVYPNAKQVANVSRKRNLMFSSSVFRAQYFVEEFGLFLRLPASNHAHPSPKLAELVGSREASKIDSLLLAFSDVTDSDLDVLEQLPNLKRLDLGGTYVSKLGIPKIAKASDLLELFLNDTLIDDKSIVELQVLTKLRAISFGGTDVALSKTVGLLDKLKLEFLFAHGLRNDEPVVLRSESIVVLDLAFSNLSQIAFGNMPRLETLVLSKAQLADLVLPSHYLPSLKSIFVVDSNSDELRRADLSLGSVAVFGKDEMEFRGANLVFREINPNFLYRKIRK